ncbi:RNA 2',3'-cyclic phosphodiesterase [Actinoplanes sp. NEAU-A12]|uniref:RNA 2',3'-cyclic phosphodiesterase n=1 Tax=Actinoplanes sandaracinus TaxID=3045177 RepID=A0ABT6WLB7_9ACTN|nr:RNA 2',3'-cyclic phosphodiesterase [Actinoplanes sandaracinus]MDI6100529.1 RNA 2',3'-cyclic phosphodiesterase [Actinoplanes sandaracinus]
MFVAVFPSEEARDHLRRHLPPGAARRPEKWHVTCAFLGDVPEEDTGFVERALTGVPAPGPINLRLTGGGRFGPVVWAGLGGDLERLGAFREDVRFALVEAGFPIDERPFRPHLTISYRYDRRIAAALDGYAGPPWTVDEFSLVRSEGGDYLRIWDRPVSR